MPMFKFYHILCSNDNKVIYEGRFQCPTRGAALLLLKEKIGRKNLTGLTYTITEFPIEVLKEIIEAIMQNRKFPEGDIVPFQNQKIEISKTKNYASIRDHKRNPHKPTGSVGVRRRLGEL